MAELIPGSDIITASISEWDTPFVENAIFGTADVQHITQQANEFCRRELGDAIAEILFYEASQGAVFGLKLEDTRRVVLKAHQSLQPVDFLHAVYQVQQHLYQHHYPCPRPLLGPRPLTNGTATVEELIDTGIYKDAHIPSVRRTMAELLALLVESTQEFIDIPGLQHKQRALPPDKLWPKPHWEIFDFDATAEGAEWIDEIARQAKAQLAYAVGPRVIGHTDWSVKHFRFTGNTVNVIYDWDSLAVDRETIIVAAAACGFAMTWHLDVPLTPSPEEARAFVAEYEQARGRTFTKAERETIAAAAAYDMAYGARCEYCFEKGQDYKPGSHLATLATYGLRYLRDD